MYFRNGYIGSLVFRQYLFEHLSTASVIGVEFTMFDAKLHSSKPFMPICSHYLPHPCFSAFVSLGLVALVGPAAS